MSAILQTLKETGMRIGEALRLKWIDIDLEKRTITVNSPEKNGNPRAILVSEKLVAMLNRLPRDKTVFASKRGTTINSFCAQREKTAKKLANQRIMRIHFHTFRHWKAKMEYHKTKDILHVMKLLGHKNIGNTLLYTQLDDIKEDEYYSAAATTTQEARKLIESGFEYVCTHENVMLFRKRK